MLTHREKDSQWAHRHGEGAGPPSHLLQEITEHIYPQTHKYVLYVNHLVKTGPQGFIKSSKWLFDQKVKKDFRWWYVIVHLC